MSIGNFIKVFILAMSILYCLRISYDIAKVLTLKEGKVELGKNGMLFLGCSISVIIAFLFS